MYGSFVLGHKQHGSPPTSSYDLLFSMIYYVWIDSCMRSSITLSAPSVLHLQRRRAVNLFTIKWEIMMTENPQGQTGCIERLLYLVISRYNRGTGENEKMNDGNKMSRWCIHFWEVF